MKIPGWVWLGAAILLGLSVGKNVVASAAVSGGVKMMTGLTLTIRRMDVGILKSAVGIRGMQLQNPPGFADEMMVDLPEMYVHYDLWSLLRNRVHLHELRLDLKEVVVVRNADGRLNLDALRAVQDSKGRAAESAPSRKVGQAPAIQLDRLHLKIGKVVFKDYTAGPTPRIQEFTVNIDERHEHITNPHVLAGLIVSRALMKTTIAKLTGFDLGPLQAQVGEQLAHATQRAGQAAEQAFGTAAETVKQTAESLKKALPFGN